MILPDDVHERCCKHTLANIPAEWTDLSNVANKRLPPSIMTEILCSLRDASLIEIRKAKGTFQVRKKA